MKFEWDPEKNIKNLKKHKIDFEEAKHVFRDEAAIEFYDESHSDTEDRYIIIGLSSKARELFVCHCYRNGNAVIRIFSARRATKDEIQLYENSRRS